MPQRRTAGRPNPRLALALAAFVCAGLAPAVAHAKSASEPGGCSEGTPAAQTPQSLWGDLRPVKIMADSSSYTGQQVSGLNAGPIHTSLDIENGYIFVSQFSGFGVWDARGAKAKDPTLLGTANGWKGGFGLWPPAGEFKDMIFGIDAPAGDDTIVAVAGSAPAGFSIWDTSNKSIPRQLYQDHGYRFTYQVYAATIGGRQYAFVADFAGVPGLHVYDMTTAKGLTTRCLENTGVGETSCGVYRGTIGSRGVKYVAGTELNGRHYIATSDSVSPRGIEVYDVTSPTAPRQVASALQSTIARGVAMWSDGSTGYLGVRTEGGGSSEQGLIFQLSGCGGGGCTGIQQIASRSLPSSGSASDWKSVTFSRSDSTPFLHFGDNLLCAQGLSSLRHESLYDVSNPANPVEVSPTATTPHPSDPSLQVDYWSWYYSTITKGYSHVAPRAGKFNGPIFYRAASSLFDAHEWVAGPGQPPSANFTWSPAEVYLGEPIDFTDTSTGAVTSHQWVFPGATPPSSSQEDPQNVVFNSLGTKQVTLDIVGPGGADDVVKNVVVVDPSPAIGAITKNVATPLICQDITFTATNVTGKAPLAYAWEVRDSLGNPLVPAVTGSSTSFLWNQNNGIEGDYEVHLTVSGTGSPAVATLDVHRALLPTLPASFTPTNLPFTHGTVQFQANVAGATVWTWNFGDGTAPLVTSDPVLGPNPSHTYTEEGTYQVTVTVQNCNAGPVVSAPLQVVITQVEPLGIQQFLAQGCQITPCIYDVGQAVTFAQQVEGDPTSFKYDWDGNGTFEQSSPTMVTTHTYTQPTTGVFHPRMRVERGSESEEVTHLHPVSILNNQQPPPPSLSISGPSSGNTGQSRSFSASAANCNPSSTGWNWTATGGGTINGNGSSSATISWASTGSKSVRVTNSGCGSAQGSKSVTISGGTTSGLTADFSFSPTAPKPGEAVGFNGGASSGSPTAYQWDFGDGSTATTAGPTTSHNFVNAGSYAVKLTVEKVGQGGSCDFGICLPETHSVTKLVVVAGTLNELAAKFVHTPAEPSSGEPVVFDAGSSTGAPTLYRWDFGDGNAATDDGPGVQHTFSAAGTYDVTLTVEKAASTGAGCDFGICIPQSSALTKSVVVKEGISANGCAGGLADDPDKLCLGAGRYVVEVDWDNYHSQTEDVGEGQVRRLGGSENTGFFWFFNPDSIDLIVKIIDGSVVNEHVWVFYGALTDVIYDLKVTDTLTNQTKTYKNLAGSICGRGDTAAFSTAGLSAPVTAPAVTAGPVTGEATQNEVLHLLDGRFRVTVDWENHHDPALKTGVGQSVTGTNGSGYFWFFEPSSLDLVVKMIDAREFDGHFWIFYGGLSDVKYSLQIEDLVTGETWQRVNPKGSICGGSDTAAFSALGG